MRPIKFRGVDTDDAARDTVTFTLEDLLADSESYGLVDPDSVAQLVGYDINGREVYEGDVLAQKDPYTGGTVEGVAELFDNIEFAHLKEAES